MEDKDDKDLDYQPIFEPAIVEEKIDEQIATLNSFLADNL